MTLLSPFQAIDPKLRALAAVIRKHGTCAPMALECIADELTELLGKVVVTDEVVALAMKTYWENIRPDVKKCLVHWVDDTPAMRAALETALGVNK